MPDSLTRREINVSLDSFGVLAFVFYLKKCFNGRKGQNSFFFFLDILKTVINRAFVFLCRLLLHFFQAKQLEKRSEK
jgi:hypothetical protein